MTEGRQTDAWAHTVALVAAIGNLFAPPGSRVDLGRFLPRHLRHAPASPAPGQESGMALLRKIVLLGGLTQ